MRILTTFLLLITIIPMGLGQQIYSHENSPYQLHQPKNSLEPNSTYRIRAFAKVESDSVRAYISANIYELTDAEKKHPRNQKTNQATLNRLQQIDLLFTTPNRGQIIELQFNVTGKGKAWLNDFSFEKLPAQEWTISDTIMDRGKPLPFRVWVAPGTKQVRGLVLATRVRAEEEFVIDPAIRKVAADEGLAIIKTDSRQFAMFDINKGEDNLFLRLLKKCATLSGFPEIEFAPWLTFGHSTAGHFAKNLAYWHPERTFGILYFKSGQLHCPVWTKPGNTLQNIPLLAICGEFEEFGPHGALLPYETNESQWNAMRDTLFLLRKTGHLVSMVVEPGEGHFCLSPKVANYMSLFIKKAAQAKIPKGAIATTAPLTLLTIDERAGILSDTCCATLIRQPRADQLRVVAPFAKYPVKQASFWHFDMEMAEQWIKFHQQKKSE